MCIPGWTVRTRSGYARSCSPSHWRTSRGSVTHRPGRPRNPRNPDRSRCGWHRQWAGKTSPTSRDTCLCLFPRNPSRPAKFGTRAATRPRMTATIPTIQIQIPMTTTTRTRPAERATGAAGVAAGVAVADAASRADPTVRARRATPPNPTTTAKTTKTATTTTRTVPRRRAIAAAAGAAGVNPVAVTTTGKRRLLTIRRTPWCTSARPAASPVAVEVLQARATPKSGASTARPGWKPSGNGAETGATPADAGRRS